MTIKTKRTICAGFAAACLLAMLGVIGGMDAGSIPFGAGAAWAFGLEAAGIAALYKAGVIRPTGARPSEAGAARRGGAGGIIEQRPEGAAKHSAESRRKAGVFRWRR